MMGVVDRGQVKGPVEVFAVKSGKAVKIYRGFLCSRGTARRFYSWGSGTEDDPYIIRTYADLKEIRNDLSAHYKLEAYITDNSPTAYHVPIGTETEPFTGSLDGNGYSIKLHRKFGPQSQGSGQTCGGLFGVSAGTIKNMNYQAVVYSDDDLASYQNFGMLAGVNRGTIENCLVVSGWKHQNTAPFGVVAGRNESGGIIRNVDCRAQFTAGLPVGKLGLLAGESAGIIEYCYSDIRNPAADGSEVGYAVHTLEASGKIGDMNTFITKTKFPAETSFGFVVQQEEGSHCSTHVMKMGSTDTYVRCTYPSWGNSSTFWTYWRTTDPFNYVNALYRCLSLRTFGYGRADWTWIE